VSLPIARRNPVALVSASFVTALLLTITPLPGWLEPFRPEWVTLVLIYWCLALPTRIGLGLAWTMGILLDVVKGTLLGQHALGLTVVAFLVLQIHLRMRVHPLWQQSVNIALLPAINELLIQWIHGMMGRPLGDWQQWTPILAGALMWPWLFRLLRRIRRHYRVG
jgi:rod shape-determining protein MreD